MAKVARRTFSAQIDVNALDSPEQIWDFYRKTRSTLQVSQLNALLDKLEKQKAQNFKRRILDQEVENSDLTTTRLAVKSYLPPHPSVEFINRIYLSTEKLFNELYKSKYGDSFLSHLQKINEKQLSNWSKNTKVLSLYLLKHKDQLTLAEKDLIIHRISPFAPDLAVSLLSPNSSAIAFSSIIQGFGRKKEPHRAQAVYDEYIGSRKKPNPITAIQVMKVFAESKLGPAAVNILYSELPNLGVELQSHHYNSLLGSFIRANAFEDAKEFYEIIQEKSVENNDTRGLICLLKVLTSDVKAAKEIFDLDPSCIEGLYLFEQGIILRSFFSEYSKAGDIPSIYISKALVSLKNAKHGPDLGLFVSLLEYTDDFDMCVRYLEELDQKLEPSSKELIHSILALKANTLSAALKYALKLGDLNPEVFRHISSLLQKDEISMKTHDEYQILFNAAFYPRDAFVYKRVSKILEAMKNNNVKPTLLIHRIVSTKFKKFGMSNWELKWKKEMLNYFDSDQVGPLPDTRSETEKRIEAALQSSKEKIIPEKELHDIIEQMVSSRNSKLQEFVDNQLEIGGNTEKHHVLKTLAECFQRKGNYQYAGETVLRMADLLKTMPDDDVSFCNQIIMKLQDNKNFGNLRIQLFRACLKLYPNRLPDSDLVSSMLITYMQMRNNKDAVSLYKWSQTRNIPISKRVLPDLLEILDLESAKPIFEKYVEDGEDLKIEAFNAMMKLEKDPKESLKIYQVALHCGLVPNTKTYEQLMRVYCRLGEHEEAYKLLDITTPTSQMYDHLVEGIIDLPDFLEKAQQLLQNNIKFEPSEKFLKCIIGKALERDNFDLVRSIISDYKHISIESELEYVRALIRNKKLVAAQIILDRMIELKRDVPLVYAMAINEFSTIGRKDIATAYFDQFKQWGDIESVENCRKILESDAGQ